MSRSISLWAATLSLAIVAVKRRMPRRRACAARRSAKQGADAAALPVVGDDDGHLGGLGVSEQADEAADRDQAADRLAGVLGHQRHVIAAVHLGQVAQLCPAEAALGGEEAPVHALSESCRSPSSSNRLSSARIGRIRI